MNVEIPSQFKGCAFVFLDRGAQPVESPSLRFDNFAGVDLVAYLEAMNQAVTSKNVIPFNSLWRQDRWQAR